jgi:DNA-binding NtrC family response regulator
MNADSPIVFVVDDDSSIRESLRNLIALRAQRTDICLGTRVFDKPASRSPSCLVLDVKLPGLSGLDLQQELAKADVQIPIIFITGYGDIPMTVRAMKAGAVEFFTKPFHEEDLLNAVEQAINRSGQIEQLRNNPPEEKRYCEDELRSEISFSEIVGQSAALRRILKQVETVAPTNSTVLIHGETGTGKELIARAIHSLSARKDRPLVKVNCGAISAGLVESELFGHEKGAFTGAMQQRIGRFELGHRGTIFLDEIGELPPDTQVKLLRVLQEGEFERVGSSEPIKVDVRIVAATNGKLKEAVKNFIQIGPLYRLSVFPLEVPSLEKESLTYPYWQTSFLLNCQEAWQADGRYIY